MKLCRRCDTEKPLDDFPNDRSRRDGKYLYCKLCAAKKSERWHIANPEQSRLTQKNNRAKRQATGKVAASERKMLDDNPSYKIAQRCRQRISTLMRKGGTVKAHSTVALLGCSFDELRVHLQSQFTAAMSWENYGQWHIDHIKPCASFDLTDPEQQKLCFHFSNLQPLWAIDNLRKNKF